MNKSNWIILFSVIFLLSQDYLFFIKWPDKLFGGFPVWIFYFMLVHVIFIFAIYRLAVKPTDEA